MATIDSTDVISSLKINDKGVCDTCKCPVPNKENIQCSKCECLFHALCSKSDYKICTKAHLDHFMRRDTKLNFLWLCHTCLISFQNPNEDKRISTLEDNFLKLTEQLSEIKSIVTAENNTSSTLPRPYSVVTGSTPAISVSRKAPSVVTKDVIHIGPTSGDTLNTAKDVISDTLFDTEVSFLTSNKKNVITVGFPNESSKTRAESLLKDNPSTNAYTLNSGKKYLPSITISNVPLDILNSTNVPEDATDSETREIHKTALKEKILNKNKYLKELCDIGHSFNIIYINKSKSITIGVKVSPLIRSKVLERGVVFISNSSCSVSDRFFILQCYHCQNIGHRSANCPTSSESPKCLYCSEPHRSSSCTHKSDSTSHKCINCKTSANTSYSTNHNHTSSSTQCPFIQKEIDKMSSKIDYSSKNII